MSHLEVLMSMFPAKVFLTVEDIAKCLNLSKGHIYNLSSAKKLPFKVDDHSDKVQVSIVAMAKYLDAKLEVPKPVEVPSPIPVPELRRKPGRPRNSDRRIAMIQMAFQAELQLAIFKEEVFNTFSQVEEQIEGMTYHDGEEPCSVKFDEAKGNFRDMNTHAKRSLHASYLQLKVQQRPTIKRSKPDF